MSTRRSVYFRPKKDRDLNEYVEKLLPYHDFSEIVRGLMRDGIKYRKGISTTPSYLNIHSTAQDKTVSDTNNSSLLSSKRPSDLGAISDINMEK